MMKRWHGVLVHRWAGLVLAPFLILVGLTGALMAFYAELDAAFAPQLLRAEPPTDGSTPLNPLQMRERLLVEYPTLRFDKVPLSVEPGRSLTFVVASARGDEALAFDEIHVDPFRGRVLGVRLWGDISAGHVNAMPFVYRLHYSLAAGPGGTLLLGLVALLWTLDCIVGMVLTLPSRGGLPGWRKAWVVRRGVRGFRLAFDLHRAGGLWCWTLLFGFAWSAVSFNLGGVYAPVMAALFGAPVAPVASSTPLPIEPDAAAWHGARERGRALLSDAARAEAVAIQREETLAFERTTGSWRYVVLSDRDASARRGRTVLRFDSEGRMLSLEWPTGQHSARTATTWLTDLHRARLGGRPVQLLVAATGLAVLVLSLSGVLIWRRKQSARVARLQPSRPIDLAAPAVRPAPSASE